MNIVNESRGMFGVTGSGDTSGYGRLVRPTPKVCSSSRPYGGYFDEVVDRLAATLGVLLHRNLDGLCYEYATALEHTGITGDLRAGKIIGTAALFSIRAREPLGLLGPAPLDGELDDPTLGVVSGFGEMCQVDSAKPWKGGRWIVRTESGLRYPLTLSMLLFDSSGVNKDAARNEHRDALSSVVSAASSPGADPLAVACALDWLLYDWLMAHRDGPDSAEIVFPKGRDADAAVVVAAAGVSVRSRAIVDPGLLAPPTMRG